MKIVYLISGTFNSGGMERVLANKANYLVEKGYEVSIITTEQKERKPFFFFSPKIKCYDLDINYGDNLAIPFFKKIFSFPRKQRLFKQRLSRLLIEMKADIVVSMFGNEVFFINNIPDGSKKILEIHFSKFFRLQEGRKGIWRIVDKVRSWQDEKLVRNFDVFVVLTEEDKTYWGSLKNIRVIPNASSFCSGKKANLENKKIIAVGRYGYQKGFDMLIDAWEKVYAKCPDWKLEIIGSGPWEKRLRKQVEQLDLTECISLKKATKDIEEEYLDASALVLSSRYEGLPMVVLEAIDCGLPIVAFTCKCGPRDIITNGKEGFLVPENDILALAERLILLIQNLQLRKEMGECSRKRAEDFSQEVIMKKWTALFEELKKSV